MIIVVGILGAIHQVQVAFKFVKNNLQNPVVWVVYKIRARDAKIYLNIYKLF